MASRPARERDDAMSSPALDLIDDHAPHLAALSAVSCGSSRMPLRARGRRVELVLHLGVIRFNPSSTSEKPFGGLREHLRSMIGQLAEHRTRPVGTCVNIELVCLGYMVNSALDSSVPARRCPASPRHALAFRFRVGPDRFEALGDGAGGRRSSSRR